MNRAHETMDMILAAFAVIGGLSVLLWLTDVAAQAWFA